MNNKYLFLVSAPHSGSTALYKILHTSPAISTCISSSNPSHVGEGSALFHLRRDTLIEGWADNRYSPEFKLPMQKAHDAYKKLWDPSKPILCDKFTEAVHAPSYFSQLGKVFFVLLTRDPYCYRHGVQDWYFHNKTIAELHNSLKNCLLLSYEDLVSDTRSARNRLLSFLPALQTLDVAVGKIKNLKGGSTTDPLHGPLENLNTPRNVESKNRDLDRAPHIVEVMKYLNYFPKGD